MKKEYIKTFQEFNLNLYTISRILTCIDTLNIDEEISNKINELIKFIGSKIDDKNVYGYDVYNEKYYVETYYEKPNFNNDFIIKSDNF